MTKLEVDGDTAPTEAPPTDVADLFRGRLGHLQQVPQGKQPTSGGLVDRLTSLESQE